MFKISDSEIRYSVLISGGECPIGIILDLLNDGKKVIRFGSIEGEQDQIALLKNFEDAGFFSVFDNPNNIELVIIDGADLCENMQSIKELEQGDTRFNLEQYVIEHTNQSKNIIVEAGAGTGKTHVMINRIMYLMHVDPLFDFSRVAMITFTNKATDNMRHRLIKTLKSKYQLTGKTEYLDRIEELSRISISTIHSFFKKVIVEVGSTLGYGTNIQLKSYIYEKRELLRDLLNKQYSGNHRVETVIGLPMYEIEKLALAYWGKLDDYGLSEEEVLHLNWGEVVDVNAKKIQDSLKKIFDQVDEQYNEIKYINNAISMKDIIRELGRVINRPELKDYISQNYAYMFCDEFQDSDNVQIQTIAVLNRIYSGNLFVVGDIKQSIYRFRGATDSAFLKLQEVLTAEERERLMITTLTKNYRTANNLLNEMDLIFREWGTGGLGLLRYEVSNDRSDRLVPQVNDTGIYSQLSIKPEEREKRVIETIHSIMSQNSKKKITVLARTNSQLRKVREWCEKEKIVCLIRERGSFYKSDAVLDFCAMTEAYLYENEPMYLYNYILSSYGSGQVDYVRLSDCDGDKAKVLEVLSAQIDKKWNDYLLNLRNKPVMSVLREIVSYTNPVENYCIRKKEQLIQSHYPEEEANQQAVIDTIQYEANLKKLLQELTDQFSGDFSSLLDICSYLRIKIMTDGDEEPAEIENIDEIDYVEGLTVHSAKGLEFENVLIPFMNDKFYSAFRSEILLSGDKTRVGWVYRENEREIKNAQYDSLIIEERDEVAKDETRLLYVAMTRAIYGLYCFVERKRQWENTPSSWAELLPKEKDNAKDI
jgi:ATP-dependent exoDNAse (exonuclease V) beta subunit